MAFIRDPKEEAAQTASTTPTLNSNSGTTDSSPFGQISGYLNKPAASSAPTEYAPSHGRGAVHDAAVQSQSGTPAPVETWNPALDTEQITFGLAGQPGSGSVPWNPAPAPVSTVAKSTTGSDYTPMPVAMPTVPPVAAPAQPGMIDPWLDPYADYQKKQSEWVKANPGAQVDPTKFTNYYDPNTGRWIHGDQGLAQRQAEWGQRYTDAMKTWGSPILTPEQQNQQYYNWDIGRQGPVNTMEARATPAGYADWLKQLLTQDNQYSRAYKDAQAKGTEEMKRMMAWSRPQNPAPSIPEQGQVPQVPQVLPPYVPPVAAPVQRPEPVIPQPAPIRNPNPPVARQPQKPIVVNSPPVSARPKIKNIGQPQTKPIVKNLPGDGFKTFMTKNKKNIW